MPETCELCMYTYMLYIYYYIFHVVAYWAW